MELSKNELSKRLNSMISTIYIQTYELQQKAELVKSKDLTPWLLGLDKPWNNFHEWLAVVVSFNLWL